MFKKYEFWNILENLLNTQDAAATTTTTVNKN